MRVPSVGLTREERRIVREGMALAERLLADHADPPGGWRALLALWRQSGQRLRRDLGRRVGAG
jgi:hypothetical protein